MTAGRHLAAAALSAAALAVLPAGGCQTPNKENPAVSPHESYPDGATQARALQARVGDYGAAVIAAVGGGTPNPGTVSIGTAPCPGTVTDLAEDGSYYVAGHWQVNLAPEKQKSTLTALRNLWQTGGYDIKVFKQVSDTEIRVDAADPKTGYSFSAISTSPPTAVAIGVVSPCVTPPERTYPDVPPITG